MQNQSLLSGIKVPVPEIPALIRVKQLKKPSQLAILSSFRILRISLSNSSIRFITYNYKLLSWKMIWKRPKQTKIKAKKAIRTSLIAKISHKRLNHVRMANKKHQVLIDKRQIQARMNKRKLPAPTNKRKIQVLMNKHQPPLKLNLNKWLSTLHSNCHCYSHRHHHHHLLQSRCRLQMLQFNSPLQ